MKTKVAVGIDIGGTNTVIGFVDKKGNCMAKTSIPTVTSKGEDVYVQSITNAIDDLQKAHQLDIADIVAIGVGAPNGNFFNGSIEYAPNLNFKGIVPLASLIKQKTGIVTFLTNDANAAAIGEKLYGVAKDIDDFVMITLGTGLGSGIFVNGDLLYGHDGFAGELGHTETVNNGRQCKCGKKGCLETYCSATGIKRTVFNLMAEAVYESPLQDIPFNQLQSKDIYNHALNGDKLALAAFDFTAKVLGKHLADVVAFSSPKLIVIFGGLANAGNILLEPLTKYFNEALLPIYRGKIQIKPSLLPQGDAAILGAAALGWQNI